MQKKAKSFTIKLALIIVAALIMPNIGSWISKIDLSKDEKQPVTYTSEDLCEHWKLTAQPINPDIYNSRDFFEIRDGVWILELSETEWRGVDLKRRYYWVTTKESKILLPNGDVLNDIPGRNPNLEQWSKFRFKGSGCLYFTRYRNHWSKARKLAVKAYFNQ